MTGCGSPARAEALRATLEGAGLVVLAVSAHRTDPELFTVYLHGAAAQWVGGEAVRMVASLPGVSDAVESVQSPTILLIRLQPPGEDQSSGQPQSDRRGGSGSSSSIGAG